MEKLVYLSEKPKPMISLVTTVFNDCSGTMLFFASMAKQTVVPSEIVVVDSYSSDGTWEVVLTELSRKDRPWKLLARQERCNVARGRNLAIESATHSIIASTDIGCDWEPKWFEELVEPFNADSKCQAVMGSWSVSVADLSSSWAKTEYALHPPSLKATNRSDASSRSIAYTRELWKNLGGYPEDLSLAGDDLTYAFLLHLLTPVEQIQAAPTIRCYWQRPSALAAFCKEARRNFQGAGEADVFMAHACQVGGRILAEIAALISALALLIRGHIMGAAIASLVTTISFSVRVWRMRHAVKRAQLLGVSGAWQHLLLFSYLIRFWEVVGFWEGWLRGAKQCQNCRQRLRRARQLYLR